MILSFDIYKLCHSWLIVQVQSFITCSASMALTTLTGNLLGTSSHSLLSARVVGCSFTTLAPIISFIFPISSLVVDGICQARTNTFETSTDLLSLATMLLLACHSGAGVTEASVDICRSGALKSVGSRDTTLHAWGLRGIFT